MPERDSEKASPPKGCRSHEDEPWFASATCEFFCQQFYVRRSASLALAFAILQHLWLLYTTMAVNRDRDAYSTKSALTTSKVVEYSNWRNASMMMRETKDAAWRTDGLMSLPRELRDKIYSYLATRLPTHRFAIISKIHHKEHPPERPSIVFKGPLEKLCIAYPVLQDEIRETCFRNNVFEFRAKSGVANAFLFREWLRIEGEALVRGLRHLEIHIRLFKTDWIFRIDSTSKGELTIEPIWPTWICFCPLEEQVRARLARPDVKRKRSCMQRREHARSFGPVVRFTLELLEATQIQIDSRPTVPLSEDIDHLLEDPCVECDRYFQMFPYWENGERVPSEIEGSERT